MVDDLRFPCLCNEPQDRATHGSSSLQGLKLNKRMGGVQLLQGKERTGSFDRGVFENLRLLCHSFCIRAPILFLFVADLFPSCFERKNETHPKENQHHHHPLSLGIVKVREVQLEVTGAS